MGISQYHVGSWESYRRNRDCLPEIATGAKRPRNDKSGAFTILTMACTRRRCSAGSGMPLPYNAWLAAWQNFPLSISNYPFSTRAFPSAAIPPQIKRRPRCGCSGAAGCQKPCPAENFGGKKSVKGNRQGFLSRSITRRSGRIAKACCKKWFCNSESSLSKKPEGTFLTSCAPGGKSRREIFICKIPEETAASSGILPII